ncbi:nucleotidyltransferase [Alkalibacillus filiformis]|uniref:nucleotidyltransferase n=1 Tax=Alkalibacillus filiformis TaxID=200990 RepID=UPI0027D874F0|nr:nucleotidyltransferase [Alkalibacillus filiformis]
MKSCGLIVEYNPFHNGHFYHQESSRQKTDADVTVAVMSSSFLQRGEPAIIDKFARTKAALNHHVDVVLELPFLYAVQYADLFAHGAVSILNALEVDYVCFGSESGDIQAFKDRYTHFKEHEEQFQSLLQKNLKQGYSFPQASTEAYDAIGLRSKELDLGQPNNILGFSYVKAIQNLNSDIIPETIQRTKSGYHDETIEHDIASATSIRQEIVSTKQLTKKAEQALPKETVKQLKSYQQNSGNWHDWELYFPYLQLIVQTKSEEELREVHGMIEGLEYKLKQTVNRVSNFQQWMEQLKTKRYTWTRLQRIFVHLLTNTTKDEVEAYKDLTEPPYIRLLGMNEQGRAFINQKKKQIDIPIISNLQQTQHPLIKIEERATDAYYSVIQPHHRANLRKQELTGPIMIKQSNAP